MNPTPSTSPWSELEVPGEPGVYFCARHKNVQTRLRCGRCEKPICPKCTSYGPTGARCRDCLSMRSSHIYQVGVLGALASFVVAAVAGVLGALIVGAVGILSFWALLYAPAIGPALGQLIVRASGGKRGTKLALIASAGFTAGALGESLFPALPMLAKGVPASIALMGLANPFLWIMLAIALGSLWMYLK